MQNLVDLDRWPTKAGAQFGQVKLTIAQFFRVDGGSTQHKGVVPDIRFPVTVDATEFGESTYDNALPWTAIAAAPHTQLRQLRADAAAACWRGTTRAWPRTRNSSGGRRTSPSSAPSAQEVDLAQREPSAAPSATSEEAKRKQREAERKALGLARSAQANDRRRPAGRRAQRRPAGRREKAAAKTRPDPLLRESAAILADAISLLSGSAKLTAQVLPMTHQATVWSQ